MGLLLGFGVAKNKQIFSICTKLARKLTTDWSWVYCGCLQNISYIMQKDTCVRTYSDNDRICLNHCSLYHKIQNYEVLYHSLPWTINLPARLFLMMTTIVTTIATTATKAMSTVGTSMTSVGTEICIQFCGYLCNSKIDVFNTKRPHQSVVSKWYDTLCQTWQYVCIK